MYARIAVVVAVDARNEVPGINSRYYTHDDDQEYIKKGACRAIPASPPTTLGWLGLQWVYVTSARTCMGKGMVARIIPWYCYVESSV